MPNMLLRSRPQHVPAAFVLVVVAILPFVNAMNNTTAATNLTEQYRLCHSDAEITALQHQYNLTRVASTPTHAAFYPGWPETLITIILNTVTFISALIMSEGGQDGSRGWFSALFSGIIPLVLLVSWFSTFIISEHHHATAGWVCANLMLGISAIMNSMQAMGGDGLNSMLSTVVLVLTVPQIICCMTITFQRFDTSKGFGTVAYNITDSMGCVPAVGLDYLQKGARSDAFRVVQAMQLLGAFFLWFLMAGCLGDADNTGIGLHALASVLVNIGVLIYEAVIATKGRPVVLSGNCMLVEMDPRLGFLDSEIDTYWKVLVSITGL